MRYIFAREKVRVTITIEPGALMLHFMPDEQALAHVIMKMLADVFKDGDVKHIAQLLRTEHDKQEEN